MSASYTISLRRLAQRHPDMEDDPLSQLQAPPSVPARALNLLFRIWARIVNPAGTRLIAPALAAIAVYLLWRAWRVAGRSALGRALRWHSVILLTALVAGLVVYLLAAPPEDPTDAAFARALAAEGVGRPVYPLWVVAVGAAAVALSALAALRTLWRARVPAAERALALQEWRGWRSRYAPRLIATGAALLGAVVAAGAGVLAVGSIGQAAVPERAAARGALWVGTPSGAARLTAAGWRAVRRPWAPLPADVVHDVAGGPDGAVWLATSGGLLRVGPDGSFVRAIVENAPLPYPTVLGVAVDARGVAWAATVAGAAGVAPDLNGRAFSAKSGLLMHSLLDAALVDRRGLVWFGGAGGVNVYEPAGDWSLPGRWPTGFNRWSTGGGLPENLVFAIHEDRAGRIWFGTDGGAAAFTPDPSGYALGSGELSRWTTYTRGTSGLAHDKVHSIAEDPSGRVYFGTEAGVSILELSAGGAPRWSAIGPERLPHPHVEALAVSPDGRLWIGTKDGLAVMDPNRPGADLPVYRSHPLRRWTALLWPPHSHQTLPATEITALAWIP